MDNLNVRVDQSSAASEASGAKGWRVRTGPARSSWAIDKSLFSAGKEGFAVVALALATGLLARVLLAGTAWGLGAAMWAMLFVVALIGVTTDWTAHIPGQRLWIGLPLLVVPFLFAWHDAPVLVAANVAALVTLSAVWVTTLRAEDAARIEEIPFVRVLAKLGFAFPSFAAAQIDWTQFATPEKAPALKSVARGAVLAVPILILFGALLSSADSRFADLLSIPISANYIELFNHTLFVAAASWFVGTLLLGCASTMRSNKIATPRPPRFVVNLVEGTVVLASVSVLFIVFIIVQFTDIASPSGFNVSEIATNARNGFFQMAVVATISLVLVTSLRKRLRAERSSDALVFGRVAALNAFLVLVILATAALRMKTYTNAFGWTELRLNTSFAMAWTAFVFGALIISVVRNTSISLPKVGIVAAYLLLGTMHLLNPHAFIAEQNIQRGVHDGFDTYYLGQLSADAVPVIVRHWEDLSLAQRNQIASRWIDQFENDYRYNKRHSDWRAWTVSSSIARKARTSDVVVDSRSAQTLDAIRSVSPVVRPDAQEVASPQTDGI